jgi:hypothetical protein
MTGPAEPFFSVSALTTSCARVQHRHLAVEIAATCAVFNTVFAGQDLRRAVFNCAQPDPCWRFQSSAATRAVGTHATGRLS